MKLLQINFLQLALANFLAVVGLMLIPSTLSLLAIVNVLLGSQMLVMHLRRQRNLKKLRARGKWFDVEVATITHRFDTAIVTVLWESPQGQKKRFDAKHIPLRRKDKKGDLKAKIYIDPERPETYEIEVFRR